MTLTQRTPRRLLSLASGTFGFCAMALVLIASGGTDTAVAQALVNHDSNAPVDLAADTSELQSRADRVVIAGNVRIDQAGLSLRAQRVTIAYSDAGQLQINRIDATGGVTVTKGGDSASGASAIYDLDRRIITLMGNVELTQGPNRLSGGRLVIDLASGRASVDGRGAPAAGGVNGEAGARRVTGRFTVPQRN
ncbi:MAG: LptA/OstA family protein [Sphingopyxis sp.]